jgi:ribosomal protein L37AE/L43A
MPKCPCCSDKLLRHARNSGIYWFCPSCWQEMPDFSSHALKISLAPGVNRSELLKTSSRRGV